MLEAKKHIKDLKRGSYRPQVFSCSDGKEYVIKFKKKQGVNKILVNEFIVHQIAVLLELPVPKGEPVLVAPETCNQFQDPNICVGVQWGTEYLKNSYSAPTASDLKTIVNHDCIPGIFLLDWYVLQNDRNNGDNLLINTEQGKNYLYLIDHESCFKGHYWEVKNLQEAAASKAFLFYPPLLAWVSGKAPFDYYFAKFDTITTEHLWLVVNALPEEWNVSEEAQQGLIDFLEFRKKIIKDVFYEYRCLFPEWN